ncbi:plastocyanin/azurin family copper-binding protein [Erythrobacter sp. EC-HK427]|uniref:plastocyanin/azurin family copper-binding protein n=1 Tax=Erythrobacter sp. EC-HK427 TaxID=2038396 RepID=UPI00125186CB|nr:plastocyanin/azurin family copper-binding protein [Erythrobacter sp. EC-HK427]VVT12759.1 conserved exported hypothetical protein [Erythrobacter sp. EC-HK427]
MKAALILTATLALTACAIPQIITPRIAPASASFAQAQRVEVRLDNFDFEPRTLTLAAGQPVVLVFTNVSDGEHNFSAPGFFAAAQMEQASANLVRDGLIEVAGNASVELRLIPAAGGYDVDCTHTGHSILGMNGSIVVR